MKQILLNILLFSITFIFFIGCSINQSTNEQIEDTPRFKETRELNKETTELKETFEVNSLATIQNWENQMMNIYDTSLPSVVQILSLIHI